MEDHIHTHAMAEVAFALAMMFFSIMVLSMVSMAIPREEVDAVAGAANNAREQLQLAAVENKKAYQGTAADAKKLKVLIYSNGTLYDEKLTALNVQTLEPEGTYILAVPPKLSVDEAMSVKASILSSDVSITLLDDRWLNRLEAEP